MLNYKSQNTDSIGADFGFTDEQMKDCGSKMQKFFEEFSKTIYEDSKNEVDIKETARKFYNEFTKEFNTQELQDLFLIQAISNFFGDAMSNLRQEQLRAILRK